MDMIQSAAQARGLHVSTALLEQKIMYIKAVADYFIIVKLTSIEEDIQRSKRNLKH